MARSLSHATRLAAALSDSIGVVLSRRCYSSAAVPSAAVRMAEEKAVASGKGKKISGAAEPSVSASSWVPDPVTGYYRPANRTAELDPAELRQRLLSERSHHR